MATLADFRDVLEPFLPAGVPWETQVRYSLLASASRSPATYGLVSASGALVKLAHFSPQEGIVLRRTEVDTAAGLALLVHEAIHSWQAAQFPGGGPAFVTAYDREEARRIANRLPVWENRFERPAYCMEADAYVAFRDAGWPPGSWTPLGISENFC